MLRLEIITPEKIVHSTDASEVIIPTSAGIIGVRRGHLPLVAPLKSGEIIIKSVDGKETEHLVIAGGFVEVKPESIRVLADFAQYGHDIDELAVQEAIERARRTKEEAGDAIELADATALLELNITKLKVAQRRKSRSHHQTDQDSKI